MPRQNVAVNVTLLGGAFGRKSKPDYAVEAALLARKSGRPVKVLFTREDEIRHAFYHPESYQLLRAAIDAEGNPTGWMHRSVFPAIGWTFPDGGATPTGQEMQLGLTTMPYRFPNIQIEAGKVPSSVRIGWMRSVCNTFHARGVQCFMDELAHELGRDPLEFHMAMLGEARVMRLDSSDDEIPYDEESVPFPYDTGRLKAVGEAAAEMGGWGRSLPEREGLGFAMHYSFYSYVAMVSHVSVSPAGELTVHRVDAALDCGPVLNPDAVEAQIQGAIAMSLSFVKHGRISLRDGAVQQSNYHDYPVIRTGEMPEVNVRMIQTGSVPTGIGEPGVPPLIPSVLNAIFAATGKRIRDLPLVGQDLG